MGMNNRQTGSLYEDKAAQYLASSGYSILERNYRCRRAEADLVAREGKYLVFVEVKQRSSLRCGSGMEAVTPEKQKRICRAARSYLYRYRLSARTPVRFDVVSCGPDGITLIRNAFEWLD